MKFLPALFLFVRHEFETCSFPNSLAATFRGFTFCVAAPSSFTGNATTTVPIVDSAISIAKADTSKPWAGTCRRMTVTLADGTVHTAQFTFK